MNTQEHKLYPTIRAILIKRDNWSLTDIENSTTANYDDEKSIGISSGKKQEWISWIDLLAELQDGLIEIDKQP